MLVSTSIYIIYAEKPNPESLVALGFAGSGYVLLRPIFGLITSHSPFLLRPIPVSYYVPFEGCLPAKIIS